MQKRFLLLSLALMLTGGTAMAKGGHHKHAAASNHYVISIKKMAFKPHNLVVPAGATIVVKNLGSDTHSVTSQAKRNDHVPGGVNGVSFDTGEFTGKKEISIPATAQAGTVIPYYCSVHGKDMKDGQITIK